MVDQVALFVDEGEARSSNQAGAPALRIGPKRLRQAVRDQVEFQVCSLDELLPEEHEARSVWAFVEAVDLTAVVAHVQAVEGGPGQPAADPRILLALWLYATLRGVGSARELARLCEAHVAYRWLCGGVSMNYHTLADFRTQQVELLDQLLTASVASLLSEGLVTLDRVAQDGMRVRASAGAGSFHRAPTLTQALAAAEAQVGALREENRAEPGVGTKRQQAARERAAGERAVRLRAALAHLPTIAEKKKPAERGEARASTTDPEARVMKMADGGFRPAFNVQFATTTGSQVITGVTVTNLGSDRGELAPMLEQHQARYGQQPNEMLVDGGFVRKEDFDALTPPDGGTIVYAPVPKSKDPTRDPHTPRPDDSPAVVAWRERMATDAAQAIYRERGATAECVNAIARNRGLRQFVVRGLRNARAVALLYAVAHNLRRAATLRATPVQVAVASG